MSLRNTTSIIVVVTALIFHSLVFQPYHTPKNYFLLIISLVVAIWFWAKRIQRGSTHEINFSILDSLLVARLLWLAITNPILLIHPSDLGFWILLSLTMLALLTRNLLEKSSDVPSHGNSALPFFRMLWILGITEAMIGVYQWGMFPTVSTQFLKTPMIGTIGAANGYGTILAICIVAAILDLYFSISKVYKTFLCTIIIIMLAALWMNGSRGAILGLISSAVAVGVIMFFLNSTVSMQRGIAIGIIATGGIILICVALAQLNVESSSGRLFAWKISLPMFFEHPITGVGQGRFAIEYLNYQARYFEAPEHIGEVHKAANLKQAHNEYLQAFCESGIIGGFIFLSIWIISLTQLIRHLRREKNIERITSYGLLGILTVILVHSLVDTPLHVLPISVIAYTTLGLIPMSVYRIEIRSVVLRWGGLIGLILIAGYIIITSWYQYVGYMYWQKGVQHAQIFRWKSAIANYEEALIRLPEKGELQFHLGSALVMQGTDEKQHSNIANREDADSTLIQGIEYLHKAQKTFNDRNIYLSMSYAYLHMKNYAEAARTTKIALAMFPDHLTPHLLLGEIYFALGDTIQSKASLRKCIRRETHIQSNDVMQVSEDAQALWRRLYTSEPAIEN